MKIFISYVKISPSPTLSLPTLNKQTSFRCKKMGVLKLLRVLSNRVLFRLLSSSFCRVVSGNVLSKVLNDKVLFRFLSDRVLLRFLNPSVLLRVFESLIYWVWILLNLILALNTYISRLSFFLNLNKTYHNVVPRFSQLGVVEAEDGQ